MASRSHSPYWPLAARLARELATVPALTPYPVVTCQTCGMRLPWSESVDVCGAAFCPDCVPDPREVAGQ